MSLWIAHVLLVTPEAHRAEAAELMARASGNPADAAPEAFSVPLCAVGGETITHWAAHTRVRATTLASLWILAALIPGSLWHITAHDDDTIEQAAARLSVDAWLDTQGLAIWREEEGADE